VIRRGMIFGTPRDWSWALDLADSARGKRRLSPVEMNNLLDSLTLSIDAEEEAKAAVRERLPRRKLPRLDR
jgi:hypothetical protein